MVDYAVGEVRLVVEYERDVVRAGNVRGGDDGDLVPRHAFAERYIFYARVRDCASHRDAVEHTVGVEVVNVERRARDLQEIGRRLDAGVVDEDVQPT